MPDRGPRTDRLPPERARCQPSLATAGAWTERSRQRSNVTASWEQIELDPVPVTLCKLTQAFDVATPSRPVDAGDRAEGTQARRAVRRRRHLTAVKEGVAAVQQPSLPVSDRDTGVSAGVSLQRDQQDLGVAARQHPHAVETEPPIAPRLVLDPARAVGPVGGDVTRALAAGWG